MPFIGVRISWLTLARNSLSCAAGGLGRLPFAPQPSGLLAAGDVADDADDQSVRRPHG
jgi:hypothetical protein